MTRKLQLLVALVLIQPCTARAGTLLTPGGNPTGPASAVGTGGSAILDPTQASEETQPQVGPLSTDDLLIIALAKQGFSAANGWTFNFIGLKGNDMTLGTYLAWADKEPKMTQGAFSTGPRTAIGFGGAQMGLNYNGANDKTNTDPVAGTHWISVLEDNNPLAFEKAHGTADPLRPGYTLSIDNPFAPQDKNGNPTTPFYDAGGAANATDFLDDPTDRLGSGTDLIFHTFVVTQPAAMTLNIFDDVLWGVDLPPAPEPGSFAMLGAGLAGLAGYAWRRRRVVTAAVA